MSKTTYIDKSLNSGTHEQQQSPEFGIYITADNYENVDASLLPVTSNYYEGRSYLLNKNYLNDIFSRIEGKMLTLIEGTAEDKEKREATKSLARQLIWNVMQDIRLLPLIKQK